MAGKKKKLNLAQEFTDLFRKPSAFANADAARQLTAAARRRNMKK